MRITELFSTFFGWRSEFGTEKQLSETSESRHSDEASHIWSSDTFRIFITHLSDQKERAAKLKAGLDELGATSFVAHKDIEPTRDWEEEIRKALLSMDCLIALMTPGFHDSLWTDQEIGVAIGRGVLVVPICFGPDPYGFIGKYQAITRQIDTTLGEIVEQIIGALLRQPSTSSKFIDAYIDRISKSTSYSDSDRLVKIFPLIRSLTDAQVESFCRIFNENTQVYDSWSFNGLNSAKYGSGLPGLIFRLTGKKFVVSEERPRVISPVGKVIDE